jgi:hypothetical protein
MSEHTKGPWRIIEKRYSDSSWNTLRVVANQNGRDDTVANCDQCGAWINRDAREANAMLIAAAPDLIVAAKNLSSVADSIWVKMSPEEGEIIGLAFKALDAAIAKAEGKQ